MLVSQQLHCKRLNYFSIVNIVCWVNAWSGISLEIGYTQFLGINFPRTIIFRMGLVFPPENWNYSQSPTGFIGH